ncbi:MAG: methylcobamide--CoM methyltransferase [Actinomycetota bacterium]|nr:methylcobamide--CoM methyltransferase [Actinomycetota bacterium]
MAIRTTVIGSYPKPPEEGGQFTMRKTLHALERGEATIDDLDRAQADLTREVIAEQESAGIDVITDGHVRWDDILTPFARKMSGFEIGGLLRWFDNNVYFRRPVCKGAIEWGGPATVDAFAFAASVASVPVKAVVPGPVTFARLSVDEHYGDHEEFTLAIAKVLAQEAFELEAAGAGIIQVDEPALLDAPEDLELADRSLRVLTSELKSATTIVATYFGDAKRLGSQLFQLPVDGFGLDFVAGPENRELIGDLPPDKTLQAGIVDARNTRLEDEDRLASIIRDLIDAVGSDRLFVAPSAGLEFLPREKARAKLQWLSDVARKVGG